MRFILFLCGIWLLLGSCTEIGPEITPLTGTPAADTTTVQRKVLVEELTGVRCVNCPAGTAEILRLQEVYGDRLVAVALHAGSFAIPYPDSRQDFRIPETNSLLNYLGSPLGYPSAVVNRKLFDGERDLQLSRGLWPLYIEQEINTTPLIRIEMDRLYDENTREIRVDVEVEALETVEEENIKLSLMLVEDLVADVQLTPEGKQADYIHHHNLRDMLTAFNGSSIMGPLPRGEVAIRNYFYTLSADWQIENCYLIALVHLDGERKDVLQVEQLKITN